jgi:cell wall-associated NlpC family hydrolase
LSLPGLGLIAGGLVLAYAGLNDPPGGPVGVVRDILSGKTPTPGVQLTTPALNAGINVAGAIGAATDVGAGVAKAVNSFAGTAARSQILSVARSYLGVKYVFGGMSRKGIDCSGLVLVAYRDGAGIKLPHRATSQAGRGRRIDRAQVLPGDLVAWGVPGNYPHIAIAVSADQIIVAPHTGTVVQYQQLWQKAVPGFGYPDIIRILED